MVEVEVFSQIFGDLEIFIRCDFFIIALGNFKSLWCERDLTHPIEDCSSSFYDKNLTFISKAVI